MRDTTEVQEDECSAVWCAGDEWCAITCTMDVIGRKWHPVIVDRLLQHDALRFNELSEEVGTITNKMLSQSLGDLEEKDLVEREIVNEQPVAVEYSLTERGQTLEPVIDSLQEWGESHLQPIGRDDKSVS